jgi:alpha-tubulin suppressor-like RCC1 family protein
MIRRAGVPMALLAGMLAGTTACGDGNGPGSVTLASLPGLVVSAPVQHSVMQGRLQASAAGPAGAGVTYVSMAPGSVPDGQQATIRDLATTQSVVAAVVDGGFDPVAIEAGVGDTLLMEITRTGSGASLQAAEVVRPTRPPVIVRTSPPRGGRDVPLNVSVQVVFNEPVDSTTLGTASVQLWQDATPVPGTVRLSDTTGFRVEFRPDAPLAAGTLYDLLVTQGVHDLNGGAVAAPIDISFETGSEADALAFATLRAAGGYTCGLTTAGAAYCWGINDEGELGAATTSDCGNNCSTMPVPVAGNLTFQSVSAGLYHACGITADGTPYCWGSSNFGALGTDTATLTACAATPYHGGCPYPVPVAGGYVFQSISAGVWHTCGLTATGAVYCWGRSDAGELGADSATLAGSCRSPYLCSTPVPAAGGHTFVSVSAGNDLTCGISTTGVTYCWGANDVGQLGIGTTAGPDQCRASPVAPTLACSRVPVAVAGGTTFTAVAAVDSSACGLTSAGSGYCWGYNGGLLGTAVPLQGVASAPVPVGGGLTFASLAAGRQYACGLTSTGTAFCWGLGDNDVFGSGTTIHISATPVQVAGGHAFGSLSAAAGWGDHSCGLATDGTAYCWGANVEGELGNGSTNPSNVPTKVAGQ